ncbi:hypothetical protein Tco_0155039 [Tanacetum coccineum]
MKTSLECKSVGIKRLHDDLGVNTAKITTARRVSTVRRIKTRERIKMKIVYQDYLRDKSDWYAYTVLVRFLDRMGTPTQYLFDFGADGYAYLVKVKKE